VSGRFSARAVAGWPARRWERFFARGRWHLAGEGCPAVRDEYGLALEGEGDDPETRFAPMPAEGAVCGRCLERAAEQAEREAACST